ncbi:MAG TPA: hypothetical protein PKC28_02655 [Bdellovibrionales bacterium]|nr:hypothetical protein [Bdellovibrionales bacterium]
MGWHRNLLKTVLALSLLAGCSTALKRNIASDWRPTIDHEFIRNSLGKTFAFKRPSPPQGEPNCVATALRGGGYLPSFALNGTDSFYERILPICFSKLDSPEMAESGDLGIIYEESVPTLAHMVLFLDRNQIYEKPSPNPQDHFRINSWRALRKVEKRASNRFEVWRYSPARNCPLAELNERFEHSGELVSLSKEIDRRIFAQDWTPDPALRARLLSDLNALEKAKDQWGGGLPGGFRFERDYPEFFLFQFKEDLLRLLLYSPAAK